MSVGICITVWFLENTPQSLPDDKGEIEHFIILDYCN